MRWTATIALTAAVFGAAAGATSQAAVPLRWVERDRIVLTIRALDAVPAAGTELPRILEVPEHGGVTEFALRWPTAESLAVVRLQALPGPARAGAPHVLRLDAQVDLPGGRRIRSEREIAFEETTTALYELCREGEQTLTLAVEVEASRESTLVTRPEVGSPIQLHLEIQRLESGRAISLETNRLETFIGEAVRYSFRLGEPGVADALEVRLLPERLVGDLARIVIEVSGTLPDGQIVSVLSRREEWMTSRGATSSLSVGTGDPPTGFRFLVTPYF